MSYSLFKVDMSKYNNKKHFGMKKLILLLLFIPLVSFGQISQRDSDLDGVNDNLDQCPNTSIDEFSFGNPINPNGCSVKQTETKAFAHLIKNKIKQ